MDFATLSLLMAFCSVKFPAHATLAQQNSGLAYSQECIQNLVYCVEHGKSVVECEKKQPRWNAPMPLKKTTKTLHYHDETGAWDIEVEAHRPMRTK
jgi:hypothetical protein